MGRSSESPSLGVLSAVSCFERASSCDEEEARLRELVGVDGVVQQVDGLLGSQFVVCIRVGHVDALKGRFIREEKTIVERVTGVDVVAQDDVRQLEGEHRGQIGLGGQHVDQALAQDDGVADRQRFQRSGKQNAAANRIA